MKKIKLGIYEESTLQFGTRSIGCVFPINAHEMISTTTREIRRFEGEEIKECVKFPFSCACFISGVGFVAAHTVSGSEIWIMRSSDLSHPILTNYKTGHTCVYHMIYSPKSKSIITIGSGIKVFKISWQQKGSHFFSSNFEVTITLRSEFAEDYDASLLNPPPFDEENERLFLPTSEGICAFNLDGDLLSFVSKLPADNNTSYSFCPQTGKILSFDPVDGLCLWKKDGTIDKRITVTSIIIIGLRFIDSENVICLNTSYSLYLLNIKTGNIFECFTSPPFTRLTRFSSFQLHYKPYVFMCYGNNLTTLRINAPWTVFSLGIIRARSIQRHSKLNKAARILVLTDNSFVKLFNPKKSCLLTSATPSKPIYPSSYFYDRGIYLYYTQDTLYRKYMSHIIEIDSDNPFTDFLYLLYEDGTMCKFDANTSPAVEIWTKDLKAHLMAVILYKGVWRYAISHLHGMLSFVETDTFERVKEISFARKAARFMFYSYTLNCLIFFMNKSIKIFDLQTELVKFKLKKEPPNVAYLFGDILYLGYQNGDIIRYKIVKWSLQFVEPEVMTKPHSDVVTSVDFSPNFYVSSSLDMTCVIWNYFHSKIIQLKVPFPIYSVAFHGVKRHLLIGSRDSLMILQGNLLFGDENWDPELIGLDSYDLLDDILDPRLIAEQNVKRKTEEAKKEVETVKRFEKSIINSVKKKALRDAFDKLKRDQDELIDKFNKETTLGAAAQTPEARQRTVDQMLQLLDLASNQENQSKENAIKNARLFIEKNEEDKKIAQNKELNEEEEEEEVKIEKEKTVSKNSTKPAKYISGAEFIKNQLEIDKKSKKSRKRKPKKKKNNSKDKELNENENEIKKENESNLLEILNSKTQKLTKSPNKKSKVEFDISKMNFADCTTENIEKNKEEVKYENSENEVESEVEKKKKKSKGNKKLKKAKSLSKISGSSLSKDSSQIQLTEKTIATSTIFQKKKNQSKLSNKSLKSADSRDSISPIKKKKISKHNSKLSIQTNDNLQYDGSIETIQNLTNDQDQQLQDDNVNEYNQFTDCIFIDDFGKIVKNSNVYLNEYGEYIDAFGEVLTKVNTFVNKKNQKQIQNGLIVSEDDQLINKRGQKVDIEGESITEIENICYSDAGCQSNDYIFMQRSIKHRIHKIKKFFHPKNQRYRSSTPPPVLWNTQTKSQPIRPNNDSIPTNTENCLPINNFLLHHIDSQSRSKRSRTPPQFRTQKIENNDYSIPQPNYVLDCDAVLSIYGRGHTELLPLIFRLVREGSVSPSRIPVPSPLREKDRQGRTNTKTPKRKKSASPQSHKLSKTKSSITFAGTPNRSEIRPAYSSPQNMTLSKSGSLPRYSQSPPRAKPPASHKNTQSNEIQQKSEIEKDHGASIKSENQEAIDKDGNQEVNRKIEDNESLVNNNAKWENTETNRNSKNGENLEDDEISEKANSEGEYADETTESQSNEKVIIDDNSADDEEEHSEDVALGEAKNELHSVTFSLPNQIMQEPTNRPTPPRQSYDDHEVFKRDYRSNSPQPPKPPSQQHQPVHEDPVRRRAPRRNVISTTFQFTSSEIYEEGRDTRSSHRFSVRKRSDKESELIKQKRLNQQKSDKTVKFEWLGVPVYQKDKRNACMPPKDHVEDCYPTALNQRGKKFEPPDHITSQELNKRLNNSDNSDEEKSDFNEEEKVTKFKATRSTRTTPNSLSMARYYGDKSVSKCTKSIIDYTYLLEPGAVEEPMVAEEVTKNSSDKDDILFSLRAMFPKTNQMAMMIQTPNSIRNTRYSTPLQEYSNEYAKTSRSKNIKIKKKKRNKNTFSLKK